MNILLKRPLEIFYMPILMSIAERQLLNSQEMELNIFKKTQSHCAKTKFSDKSSYDRIFQPFIQKGGESAMHFIKIFQNVQALSVFSWKQLL